MKLSPELDLVAQCCRWNFLGAENPTVAPHTAIDWPRFLCLVRFHRVQGLAWRALSDCGRPCPNEIAERLSEDALATAAESLQAATESRRILSHFNSADLPILFLKGPTLAVLAYGTASTKSATDIDILVEPTKLDASANLLRHLGYVVVEPAQGGHDVLRRWHRLRKESSWLPSGSGVPVDFHTRLTDNPRLLVGVNVKSTCQSVQIGNGICLPTLRQNELFAYLAVHGASSAWFRMKWVSDFGGLISGLKPAEMDSLYRQAQHLGAGRAAAQGLLLSDSLFGTLEQLPGLRNELRSKRAVRRLHAAAFRQLASNQEPIEPTSSPFGTLTIHWTQFLLQSDGRFKWSELARQARVMFP